MKIRLLKLSALGMSVLLTGCFETPGVAKKSRAATSTSVSSVSPGQGLVFGVNPIVYTGNESLDQKADLSEQVIKVKVTESSSLNTSCEQVGPCLSVQGDTTSSGPLANSSTRWGYDVRSSEFLQVNAYYHLKKLIDLYQTNLKDYFTQTAAAGLDPQLSFSPFPTGLPGALYISQSNWALFKLKAYADCDLENNAVYDVSDNSICFGHDLVYKTDVKFAQDPSVIYHELGHSIVDTMMNMRNKAENYRTSENDLEDEIPNFVLRSELGQLYYDEAGALNEGIADFFSYYTTHRTHMGEWALGRFNKLSRPMSERDPLHAPGINESADSRFAYPRYLGHDPNRPEELYEDIHFAGQIASHYFVALSEEIVRICGLSTEDSVKYVGLIITETLAELGDLTSQGNDFHLNPFVNMTPAHSMTWMRVNNPINFRTFFQTFAKYQLRLVANLNSPICASGGLSQDRLEALLDMYGLLLFRSYNESGQGQVAPAYVTLDTAVNPANRLRSELAYKENIKLEDRPGEAQAFVFDDQVNMREIISSLTRGQLKEEISPLMNDLAYNNGKGTIGPGEFVGIHLNLFNDSNTLLSGVEVLANDWSHFQGGKPCQGLDEVINEQNGGVPCDELTMTNFSQSDRQRPICMIEYKDDSKGTRWVSQSEYASLENISSTQCLEAGNLASCFLRFPKGGDVAYSSQISPQKTWAESFRKENGDIPWKSSNVIFMEVNPELPYGTKVDCRFRVRFTNCDDCYYDDLGNQYSDLDFAGGKPFKVINFQFSLIECSNNCD